MNRKKSTRNTSRRSFPKRKNSRKHKMATHKTHSKTTKAQQEFMKKAITLAKMHMLAGLGGPFGAIVVKDGKVIAEGYNEVTSLNDPTAHAEVQAIRRAAKVLGTFNLTGCELYTSCEPCPMCLGAIYWARPDMVYYAATRKEAAMAGFDDEFIYKEIPLHPSSRKIPMHKLDSEIVSETVNEVFELWAEKEDKIEY